CPHCTRMPQPLGSSVSCARGSTSNERTSAASTSRWPSRARNTSMATIFNSRDSTAVLAPVEGSKNEANDSPICRPTNSPAVCTAANTMRMVNPMATPISTCWPSSHSPAYEPGGMAGGGSRPGTTATVSMKASATLIRIGMVDAENSGALPTSASMRTNGQRNCSSHASSCCWVKLIMACKAGCRARARLRDQQGNLADQLADVVGHQAQQPGTHQHQHAAHGQQLGNERQRHFVDLRS